MYLNHHRNKSIPLPLHYHFPCLSFPQARMLKSTCCTFLCFRAAALWPEKAEGGAGASLVPPLQQGGPHYTHGILNEKGREPDRALEFQCCCFPHVFHYLISPLGRCCLWPGELGAAQSDLELNIFCWTQGKSHSRARVTEQEWGLCTGLCLLGLGRFLLLIFPSRTQRGT